MGLTSTLLGYFVRILRILKKKMVLVVETNPLSTLPTIREVKPLSCNACLFSTHSFDRLMRHARRHKLRWKVHKPQIAQDILRIEHPQNFVYDGTKLSLYQCQNCKKYYSQLNTLIEHSKECIASVAPLQSSSVPSREPLTEGERTFTAYQCIHCRKRFSQHSNLERHLMTHTSTKPFECGICRKAYFAENSLKKHMMIHEGGTKFPCHYCEECFEYRSGLRDHLDRIHSVKQDTCNTTSLKEHIYSLEPKSLYRCKHCQQCFVTKKARSSHVEIVHTKPFRCGLCVEHFSHLVKLRNHIKTTHGVSEPVQCEYCQAVFKHVTSLVTHKKIYFNGSPFPCEHCENSFTHRCALLKHVQTKHAQEQFKCKQCEKVFGNKKSLKRHILTHTKIKVKSFRSPFPCDHCEDYFIYRSALHEHMERNHAQEPYKCKECEKVFDNKRQFRRHVLTHEKIKSYKCKYCEKCFRDGQGVKSHINREHLEELPHQCEFCGKRFLQSQQLACHRRVHTKEKPFHCQVCPKQFARSEGLKDHILRVHSMEKPFKCELCQSRFAAEEHLRLHINHHNKPKLFQCHLCQKCFVHNVHLQDHIRTHTGVKPYECQHCPKSYTTKSHLTQHILKAHSTEKPHECQECRKRFATETHLKDHMRTHLKDNLPFKCEYCPKTFLYLSCLQYHVRVHTREKPFTCEQCGRNFAQKSSLKMHMRTHTGEKPYECPICPERFAHRNVYKNHVKTHEESTLYGDAQTSANTNRAISSNNIGIVIIWEPPDYRRYFERLVTRTASYNWNRMDSFGEQTGEQTYPLDLRKTKKDLTTETYQLRQPPSEYHYHTTDNGGKQFILNESARNGPGILAQLFSLRIPKSCSCGEEQCYSNLNPAHDVVARITNANGVQTSFLGQYGYHGYSDILRCNLNHVNLSTVSDQLLAQRTSSENYPDPEIDLESYSQSSRRLANNHIFAQRTQVDGSPETEIYGKERINNYTLPSRDAQYNNYTDLDGFNVNHYPPELMVSGKDSDKIIPLTSPPESLNPYDSNVESSVQEIYPQTLNTAEIDSSSQSLRRLASNSISTEQRTHVDGSHTLYPKIETYGNERINNNYTPPSSDVQYNNYTNLDGFNVNHYPPEWMVNGKDSDKIPLKSSQSSNPQTLSTAEIESYSRPSRHLASIIISSEQRTHVDGSRTLYPKTDTYGKERINNHTPPSRDAQYNNYCTNLGGFNVNHYHPELMVNGNDSDNISMTSSQLLNPHTLSTAEIQSNSQSSRGVSNSISFAQRTHVDGSHAHYSETETYDGKERINNNYTPPSSDAQYNKYTNLGGLNVNHYPPERMVNGKDSDKMPLTSPQSLNPYINVESSVQEIYPKTLTTAEEQVTDEIPLTVNDDNSATKIDKHVAPRMAQGIATSIKEMLKAFRCYICGHSSHSLKAQRRHIARHMKRFKFIAKELGNVKQITSIIQTTQDTSDSLKQAYDATRSFIIYLRPAQREKHNQHSSRTSSNEESQPNLPEQPYVKQHESVQTESLPSQTRFSCTVCDKQFTLRGKYRAHIRTHDRERPYECETCQKRFVGRSHLKIHMRVHTHEQPYPCEFCSKRFSISSNLKSHVRIHTLEKPYQCEYCQKRFTQSSNFKIHLRIHTKEKPFKCEFCQRSFVNSCSLARHIRTHTKEKPYRCDVCGKRYTYRYSLTLHSKQHAKKQSHQTCKKGFTEKEPCKVQVTNYNKAPNQCEICHYTFTLKENLKRHVRIAHLKEKPFKCDLCPKRYARKYRLTAHQCS
ncbi:uncharacterized protein [Amphiura filiformis]|uniref:uncharacterized protein n=1 Tax=Amphiura filiformis TaxID=82378 RepID=UPI003B2177E1